MFGETKSEELKEILSTMGTEEIGMTFTFNHNDMISCSCGNYKKIEMHDITERGYDEELGISYTVYKCPFCGNTTIIPYVDVDDCNIPILYEPEILRNDELFWVMTVNATWLYVNINDSKSNLSTEKIDNDSWVIVYDKKKEFLFIAEREEWHYTFRNWWENCEVLEYRNGYIYDKDGEEVTEIMDASDLTSSHDYDYGYMHEYPMIKKSKMFDVLKLIADVANVDISVIEDFDNGFDDLLKELMLYANIKWFRNYEELMHDDTNRNLKIFGLNRRDDFVKSYFQLSDIGIDMKADTFQDAVKIPLNVLKECSSHEEYQKVKIALSKMDKYSLPTVVLEWLKEDIPYKLWDGVIKLSEELNSDVETVIKHIHRGVGNGFDASTILNCYFVYIKKGLQHCINIHSSFTNKVKRQWDLLTNEKMTTQQYSMIAAKPTLDTFVKAMGL